MINSSNTSTIPEGVAFIEDPNTGTFYKMPTFVLRAVTEPPLDQAARESVEGDTADAALDELAVIGAGLVSRQPRDVPEIAAENVLLENGFYGFDAHGGLWGPFIGDLDGYGVRGYGVRGDARRLWNYDGRSCVPDVSHIVHVVSKLDREALHGLSDEAKSWVDSDTIKVKISTLNDWLMAPIDFTTIDDGRVESSSINVPGVALGSSDYEEIIEATLDDLLEELILEIADSDDPTDIARLMFVGEWLRQQGALTNEERQREMAEKEELDEAVASFRDALIREPTMVVPLDQLKATVERLLKAA